MKSGEYGAINTQDTTTLRYDVVNYLSYAFTLQEYMAANG